MGSGLGERGTRHNTSVLQSEGGQCVSRMVQCSVRSAEGGFGTEEAWQCTGAGERKTWRKVLAGLLWSLRDVCSVGSMIKPSAGREISRYTSVYMRGANQCRSRRVLPVQEMFKVVRECWQAECTQAKAPCKEDTNFATEGRMTQFGQCVNRTRVCVCVCVCGWCVC